MKPGLTAFVFALPVCLAGAAFGAELDLDRFEDNTAKLQSYKYGDDVDLSYLEKVVAAALKDPRLRGEVEDKLLDTLSCATTKEAKSFICRLLRTVGTERAVPQLAAMLTDKELSHMARYALGRMKTPEASCALHKALEKTSGWLKAGIINTLSKTGYREALPDLMELVDSHNRAVAVSAVKAMGRFGGSGAVRALKAARSGAPEEVKLQIDSALLRCAEKFSAGGQKDKAAAIYKQFYSSECSEQLRAAGLRGLVETRGEEAVSLLGEAIKGGDPELRRNAVSMFALVRGEEALHKLEGLYKSLEAESRERVVRGLADRAGRRSVSLIMDATKDPSSDVRLAAYEALGESGNPRAVELLAKACAVSQGEEKKIAQASLLRIRGKGVDEAFIRCMKRGDTAGRVEIIRAIGRRHTEAAFASLFKVAGNDGNAEVRREAILSMGRVAGEGKLEDLVALLVNPKSPEDRSAIQEAIGTVFGKVEEREAKARPVLRALQRAPENSKPVLLRLLAEPATAKALKAVRSALKSSNDKVKEAAIRSLSNWPNPQPGGDLYRIAASDAPPAQRKLALRGYVNLAPLCKDPAGKFMKALELAGGDEGIKCVLRGMARADSLKALELAEKYMKKEQFKGEAMRAAVEIAGRYWRKDAGKARSVLSKVKSATDEKSIRKQAEEVFKSIERYKNHILAWKAAGPYTLENVRNGKKVFENPFPPEKTKAKDADWIKVKARMDGDRLDLERILEAADYCSAYLRTRIWSPKDQKVRIEFKADDYIKGWLNGEPTDGGELELEKGYNPLMVKVGDHGGGWSFSCRIFNRDGSHIPGLKFLPE